MTTLIAVYTSEGRIGQCDAKCYNATHPDCDCVCGGRNHGEGFQRAYDNTKELADRMVEEYARAHNFTIHHFDNATQEALQASMWPEMVEPRPVKQVDPSVDYNLQPQS